MPSFSLLLVVAIVALLILRPHVIMMKKCCSFISLVVAMAFFATPAHGFVVKPVAARPTAVSLEAHNNKLVQVATTAAIALVTSPLVALAEEDYEYGAVNAPGGIALAWGVGVLAILTALLPVALKGGEEAFEEMKDRDSDKWGSGKSDALNKRK